MDKFQALKTSGLIGMVSLILVIGIMVLWPWQLDTRSAEIVRAKQKAEIVAYQIVQIYKEAQLDSSPAQPVAQKRGMASVNSAGYSQVQAGGVLHEFRNAGVMGTDPWGQPYQYRILNLETGPRLIVWSTGPNKVLDNPDFQSEDVHEALALPKNGDDIRVVLAINGDSK
jgi:type II secretory pathway pseudopilin PulG